jgi:hypothetical protein
MKWIGNRISYVEQQDKTTIIITPEQPGFIKALLGAWFFMWLSIGFTIVWSLYQFKFTQQEQVILFVFMVFWSYYAIRVGRTFFWSLWGREYIKIDPYALTLKTSIKDYGKSKNYFLENIKKFAVDVPETHSFQTAWENSPWIRGGERISFDHFSKNVRFGRKLNEKEAKQLFQLITKKVDDYLKKKKKSDY